MVTVRSTVEQGYRTGVIGHPDNFRIHLYPFGAFFGAKDPDLQAVAITQRPFAVPIVTDHPIVEAGNNIHGIHHIGNAGKGAVHRVNILRRPGR